MADFANLHADFESQHIEGFAREGNTPFSCPLISQIDGNLWQGGCINGVSLMDKFEHVISLYPWERYVCGPTKEFQSFTEVRLLDGPVVPNEYQLYALAGWVNVCRALGPTLVHCQAGLNRSGLLAGLSLVISGWKPEDAIARLRETRSPAVLCNKKFAAWLLAQDVSTEEKLVKQILNIQTGE